MCRLTESLTQRHLGHRFRTVHVSRLNRKSLLVWMGGGVELGLLTATARHKMARTKGFEPPTLSSED